MKFNHLSNNRSPLPNHIQQCHFHTSLKSFQGSQFHHLPGQLVSMLGHPLCEEILLDILYVPWHNLRVFSCVLSHHPKKKTNTLLSAASFLVAVEINEVSPQLTLLQTKQPQILQLLLIFLMYCCIPQFLFPQQVSHAEEPSLEISCALSLYLCALSLYSL